MTAVTSRRIGGDWPVYDNTGSYTEMSEWKIQEQVPAKEIWDEIMKCAYENGEPGIFFYDNLNRDNNIWYKERIVCSNPCSEYLAGTVYGREPDSGRLLDSQQYGGACNLGSLFLHNFVINPFTDDAFIDSKSLSDTIRIAIRMLDNIIDINRFPNRIFENYQKSFRTVGLGVTGLADTLVMLGIRYNSKEARDYVNDLMSFISAQAFGASSDLAAEKGSFQFYDAEQYLSGGFIWRHKGKPYWDETIDKIRKQGIRNAKIMSIAPTGTLSLSFGNNCLSGIEPIFCLEYDRKVHIGGQEDDNVQTVHMEDYAYHMWKQAGSPERFKDVFVTALEMDVNDHVDMLGVIASHVDMSISKTINVPVEYTFEQTKDIYKKAWKIGIKGCTIFRPNELRHGVLISNQRNAETDELHRGDIIRCRDMLHGVKKKLITGCGTMHLHAYYDPTDGNILETFVSRGSTGGCEKNQEAVSRLMSLSLRGGMSLESVIDQLLSCSGCSAYRTRSITKRDTSIGNSCPTAIAYALSELQDEIHHILENGDASEGIINTGDETPANADATSPESKCPECGGNLRHEGGCNICPACGWSKCS